MQAALSNSNQSEILLEAGTNEVEIFEFSLGDQRFGVNVAKVNQIIQREQRKITRADLPPPGVLGTITFRGKPVMTLDLRQILGVEGEEVDPSRALMLVTHFNDQTVAFAIDAAERIHRISWSQFEPIGGGAEQDNPFVNGIVRIDERLILILDLEYILSQINPRLGITVDRSRLAEIEEKFKPRERISILFAEDSGMIRKMVASQLGEVGFTNLRLASNGEEAYRHVEACVGEAKRSGRPVSDFLDLVLTDIEMPVMDGLTLCKKIKRELELDVPVVVFSSLINEQMIGKCRSVGADDWGSKPKVSLIVDVIDRLIVQAKAGGKGELYSKN